jgi:hypothetical protein
MRNSTKQGPAKVFLHSADCKIQAADPDAQIAWSEVEGGHWEAVCVCGVEHYFEPIVDRVRRDPLDPKTSRHLGQCEYVAATDPALLRIVLKVKDGANDGYWWVECQGCDTAWQVPYFAESVG